MLDIAFELIGEATWNSLLMFCFCNIIIVIILTGSSKPGSMNSQDSTTFTSSVSYDTCSTASNDHDCVDDDDKEMTIADISSTQEDESLISDSSDSDEDRESNESDGYEDDNDDDEDEIEEAEVEEEEGDDDLRKRVEEFIAKVNNEWRHEKLRALNLVC